MGVYTTVGLPWLLFLYPSFVSLRLEEEEEEEVVDWWTRRRKKSEAKQMHSSGEFFGSGR